MKQILVYSDSLTWGIIPNTRERLPFDARWPGVMENTLLANEIAARVIEDCLNGRRTVFEDPFKPGRNGLAGLEQRIEVNSPLALVILMLGTNDFQSTHQYQAMHAAQGMGALVDAVRRAPIEPGMPTPKVMVVAPPSIQDVPGPMQAKFSNAVEKSRGLSQAYAEVAQLKQCEFFDASQVVAASPLDGVHLDAAEHATLGKAMAEKAAGIV